MKNTFSTDDDSRNHGRYSFVSDIKRKSDINADRDRDLIRKTGNTIIMANPQIDKL
jgi:hypothetical protein